MAAEEPAWPMRPEVEATILRSCHERPSEINALALFKYTTVHGKRKVTDECMLAYQSRTTPNLQRVTAMHNCNEIRHGMTKVRRRYDEGMTSLQCNSLHIFKCFVP